MTAGAAAAQGSFCQTPMEQAALAFLPSAKTAEDVRETVTGSHSAGWLAQSSIRWEIYIEHRISLGGCAAK